MVEAMAGLTGVQIASALGLTQQGVSVILRRRLEAELALTEVCDRVLQRAAANDNPEPSCASSA